MSSSNSESFPSSEQEFLPLITKEPEELIRKYHEYDHSSTHNFRLQILKHISEAIYSDDVANLPKLHLVINNINFLKDKESVLNSIENPFRHTNIVLLTCKLQKRNVLEFIFSSSDILSTFSLKIGINVHPADEDEHGHNAFYYVIRGGKVALLKTLIDKWPSNYFVNKSDELYIPLLKAYEELKLRNVDIPYEMEIFTQFLLCSIYYHVDYASVECVNQLGSMVGDKEQCDLLLENINHLTNRYSDEDMDDTCYFDTFMRFIARSVSALKRNSRLNVRLPWEEMEFLLVTYINVNKSQEKVDAIYHSILSKEKIFKYLKVFANILTLEDNVTKSEDNEVIHWLSSDSICSSVNIKFSKDHPFKELCYNYHQVRDVYSLEIIKVYSNMSLPPDHKQKSDFLFMRCLQILEETLNNTLPSKPSIICEVLLHSLSENTLKVLQEIHAKKSCIAPFSSEERETETSYDISDDIVNDICKVNRFAKDILNKTKNKAFRTFLVNLTHCKSLAEVVKVAKSTQFMKFNGNLPKKCPVISAELDRLIERLSKTVKNKTASEKELFDKIHKIIESDIYDLKSNKINYTKGISLAKYLISILSKKKIVKNEIKNLKRLARKILFLFGSQMQSHDIKTIVELSLHIRNSIISRSRERTGEMYCIFLEMFVMVGFEVDNNWVEEKWNKFQKISYNPFGDQAERNMNTGEQINHNKLISKLSNHIKGVLPPAAYKLCSDFDNVLPVAELNNLSCNDLLLYKNNRKLQGVMEMLVSDLLSVLYQSRKGITGDLLYLEECCPLSYEKVLHNFLFKNPLIDMSLFDPSILVLVNAVKLSSGNFPKEHIHQNFIFKCNENHLQNVAFMINQKNMFLALEEGKLEVAKKCIENGADINARNSAMSTSLHFAAKGPSLEVIQFVAGYFNNFNVKDVNGQIPLHIAVMYGRKNIVKYFIDNTDASINSTDNFGKTPLAVAVENGFIGILKIIFRIKSSTANNSLFVSSPLNHIGENYCENIAKVFLKPVNTPDKNADKFTLLHTAVGNSNTELIDMLLKNGENVNAYNNLCGNPLHVAATNGFLNVVKYLISNNALINERNIEGCTPLHCAVENGHEEVAKVLVEHGNNINVTDKVFKLTPLCYAAREGNKSITKFLLEKKASVNIASVDGMMPLHFAVMAGHKDIVDILISNETLIDAKTNEGMTALHISAAQGHKDILQLLIKKGGNINARNKTNMTPLHLASKSGSKDALTVLICEKANINSKDSEGFTSLHLSCMKGHIEIMKNLLNNSANVNAVDKYKRTPLHLAANYGVFEAINTLLEQGASVNSRDSSDFNPLHLAALNGNTKIVQNLINNNAELHISDKYGVTPFHLAVQSNHTEVIEILIEAGSNINAIIKCGSSLLNFSKICWENHLKERICELIAEDIPFLKLFKSPSAHTLSQQIYTPLYFAVCNKNVKIVTLLLSKSTKASPGLSTCLYVSVYLGYNDILAVLLKFKNICRLNKTESVKLLSVAAFKGCTNAVQTLLAAGTSVNTVYSDFHVTPLYLAVEKGHSEIVKLLLTYKANTNDFQISGTTALHRAAFLGHAEIVKLLLEYNPSDANNLDLCCTTPLERAVAHGHKEVAEVLLKCKNVNINYNGQHEYTVLHIAAQEGRLEMVKYLLDKGADINATNNKGSKPIHIAARDGHINIVEFLLKRKVDVNVRGVSNQTLLHYAVMDGHIEIVNLLIQENIDMNVKDIYGNTALHFAVKLEKESIVKTLLENGAHYNIWNSEMVIPYELSENDGITNLLSFTEMIFNAVKDDNTATLENAIRGGGVINAKNRDGITPLMYAACKGRNEIVDTLLKYKANTNAVGKGGSTALHYACKFSHFEVVMSLLKNGAIYDIATTNKKIPLVFAVHEGITKVLKLIDELFRKLESGNTNFISYLKSVSDNGMLQAILNCCNGKKQTIIECAVHNGYPELKDVRKILSCSSLRELSVSSAHRNYEEDLNELFTKQ